MSGFADTNVRLIEQGIGPVKVSLATAVSRGDLLAISGLSWTLADGDAIGTIAELIAGETGAAGDVITAYMEAVISGFVTASSLLDLYLSDTAGSYASAAGTVNQRVGSMIASTTGYIRPMKNIPYSSLVTATAADILVFQGDGAALAYAVSGDATIAAGGGLTIAALAVEGTMIAADAVTPAKLHDDVEGIFTIQLGCYATGIAADYAAAPTACVLSSVTFYNKTGAALTSAPVVTIGGSTAATCSTTTLADKTTDKIAASAVTTVAVGATVHFAVGTSGGTRQPQTAILECIYQVKNVA